MTSPFISVSELAEALQGATPPVLLDASLVLHAATFDGDYRRDSGYPRWVAAHIPGSIHVDVATQFSDVSAPFHYSHPQPQEIADELARLGIRSTDSVVVYDSTGTLWAARLWYLLRWIGVDVRVLDGGIPAWQAAGESVVGGRDSSARARADLASRCGARRVDQQGGARRTCARRPASARVWVARGCIPGSRTDALRAARRIPGSVNVSSRDLFTTDGHVKSRVELILAYDAAGVDVAEGTPREVLLYCGGGISAAANALTLAEIGTTSVRIYDGSLEEWSADPTMPLDVD